MPSLFECRNFYKVDSVRNTKLTDSDMIMEETWNDDIQSQVGYLYDWYHDTYRTVLKDLCSQQDFNKVPIDIKYIVNSSQTYSKDIITYHLQLRPSQECNVDYYDDFFKYRYGANFPNGLYIDICDAKGKYNRWLVVGGANYYDPQFPTFEILPCDYIFQWIVDGKKYQMAGVLRSQNSYNAGIWSDYKQTTVEDQQKFIVPINRDTERLYYDQRMIIDAPVLTEPRTWEISKINRISANGLVHVTLAQNKFNQHTDFIEVNDEGNVIGMWADYYSSAVIPVDVESIINCNISFSGIKPEIKVHGGYKKFTVNFCGKNFESGKWNFYIDREDASGLVQTLSRSDSNELEENQIKVKFIGSDDYLGKVLTVKYTSDSGITSALDVSITSL